jgi:uncharacterized protein YdaU (DUF1376 family)
MHYYQKNIGDYRRDTMNLSLLEHGVYMTLIDHYTLNEEPISLDHLDVCWTIGARTDNEKTAVCLILSKFFIKTDEGYKHKRCDEEIEKYHAKSDKAKESINKRWNKDTNVIRTYNEGNTNHKPITNNHKPITNKDFEKFYEAYPKKKNKPSALKAWLKHKPDINVVLKSLIMHKKSDQWTMDKGKYIPYPASWLNAEGWNDEIETKKVNSTYASFIK